MAFKFASPLSLETNFGLKCGAFPPKAPDDENGQQKSLPNRLAHVFDNQLDCDVTFSFPDGNQFSAHKLILRTGSPVFEAMFSGNFVESTNVDIVDVENDVFQDFVRFLYTDVVQITDANVMALLYVAKKYLVDLLVTKCRQYVTTSVSNSNLCSFFSQGVELGEDTVVAACHGYMMQHRVCFQEDNFLDLSPKALLAFAKLESLPIDEITLYKACLEWCKKRRSPGKTSRQILGEILFQVRFHAMDPRQLAELLTNDNILTSEEKNHFLCYSLTKSDQEKSNLETLGFTMSPRNINGLGNRCTHCGSEMHMNRRDLRNGNINFYRGFNGSRCQRCGNMINM